MLYDINQDIYVDPKKNLKSCGDLGDHAIDGGDHDMRHHRVAERVH